MAHVASPVRPDTAAAVPSEDSATPAAAPLAADPGSGALTRCRGGMPFEWTLDPYRGCAIACGYCCARYAHAFLGHASLAMDDPRDFERRIFWKEDLPRLLGRDLDRRVFPGQRIALGTATDPYQPLEREKEVTRNCLRVLARRAGLRISVATKSDLVLRDLDLLRVVAARNSLHVNVTVTTLDRCLARALEPLAPTPARRLAAVHTLAAEGIETGVLLVPVLPGLTDGPGAIEEVAREAAAAGARFLVHQCLFLREPTRSFWLDRIRERWPALLPRYRRWYEGGSALEKDLRRRIGLRVGRARRAAGLAEGPSDRTPPDPQMTLAFAASGPDPGERREGTSGSGCAMP